MAQEVTAAEFDPVADTFLPDTLVRCRVILFDSSAVPVVPKNIPAPV